MKDRNIKVFAAMSGGVDSSVAALLLKSQGYDVVGVFMRCFNVDGCAERDAEDARRVAEQIGVPFYVWDFEKEYKEKVVEYMVKGYKAGETPNPDVMCNREIKFGIFYKRAMAAGADYVATGHYVSRRPSSRTGVIPAPAAGTRLHLPGRTSLRKDQASTGSDSSSQMDVAHGWTLGAAKDLNKDQSYFLWTLGEDVIAHSLFPIGDYLKSEVRAIAKKAGLITAEKKDSQGICFLGDVSIEDFLRTYIPAKEGAVLNAHGETIGKHRGAEFYTIGQRHIALSRRRLQNPDGSRQDFKPVYVAEKDVRANTLTVVEGGENPALFKKEISLRDAHFADASRRDLSRMRVLARVRYRQPFSEADLIREDGGWHLNFSSPQKFVAPGQSAVFYSEEGDLLGGAVIEE